MLDGPCPACETTKRDAAARSAARIRTLLECRKTRVPGADEIAEIIRAETAQELPPEVQDNVAMVVESFNRDVCGERDVLKRENRKLAADVAELVAALCAMTPDYSHLAFQQDDADVAAVRRKVIDNARAVLAKHR